MYFFSVGASVGIIGYLFGLGGGIILVPILAFSGIPIHQCTATSLAIVVVNSIFVSRERLAQGEVDLDSTGVLEFVGVFGAIVGALAAQSLEADYLKKVFSFFTVSMAILMLYRSVSSMDDSERRGNNFPRSSPLPLVLWPLGGVAGFLSALLGIGAGALVVPALNVGAKMDFKRSAAISSYVSGIFALTGMIVLWDSIRPDLVVWLLISVRVGALGARKWASKVKSVHLVRSFAVLLFIISIKMWV